MEHDWLEDTHSLTHFTLVLKTSKLYWSGNTLAGRAFHSLAVRLRNEEPNRLVRQGNGVWAHIVYRDITNVGRVYTAPKIWPSFGPKNQFCHPSCQSCQPTGHIARDADECFNDLYILPFNTFIYFNCRLVSRLNNVLLIITNLTWAITNITKTIRLIQTVFES